MRVRLEMVLELRIEYGERESSSDAHLPNVIRMIRTGLKLPSIKSKQFNIKKGFSTI